MSLLPRPSALDISCPGCTRPAVSILGEHLAEPPAGERPVPGCPGNQRWAAKAWGKLPSFRQPWESGPGADWAVDGGGGGLSLSSEPPFPLFLMSLHTALLEGRWAGGIGFRGRLPLASQLPTGAEGCVCELGGIWLWLGNSVVVRVDAGLGLPSAMTRSDMCQAAPPVAVSLPTSPALPAAPHCSWARAGVSGVCSGLRPEGWRNPCCSVSTQGSRAGAPPGGRECAPHGPIPREGVEPTVDTAQPLSWPASGTPVHAEGFLGPGCSCACSDVVAVW